MLFKNNKSISISKVEYEDVKFLWSISSCLADHIEKVAKAFNLDYNKAYNLSQAVRNNYKYMQIK
jgi:hypothetical protein